jgi:hypothetical protein
LFSENHTLTNSTLFIYHNNNTLFRNITNSSFGADQQEATINETVSDFSGGSYYWNVLAYATNSTGDVINVSSENRTFEWRPFSNDGEDYTNSTTEGNIENFQINISLTEGFQLGSATLYYDGTGYLGSQTSLGSGSYEINREITIPSVSADENKTFYWTIVMEDGTTVNTTSHNQSVSNINIDDCSSYSNVLLNLSLVDEETQLTINETTQDPFIKVDVDIYAVGSSTPLIEYSNNFTDSNTGQVCIDDDLANSDYTLDTKIQYGGIDYRTEQYNIQDYPLNSTTLTQNIILYDILTDSSESFIINIKDGSFLPLDNAIVDISREYVEEGQFKSIEIPITDSNGRAVASLSPEDTTYTITVSEGGETVAIFSNILATCQNELTGECELNLNVLSTVEIPEDYTASDNVRYTMTWNPDTRTIQVTFNTIDGTTALMELEAMVWDNWMNDTACEDDLTSSSGTLTCIIPESYSNQTVTADLYKDSDLINSATFSLKPDPQDYFGVDVFIFALLIVITIPLMFITSVVGMIVGGVVGLLFVSLLLFVTDGGALGFALSGVWLLVAAIIIIWKISHGGNSQ